MKLRIHILSAAAALLCCAPALPAAAQEQTPAKASAQPAPAQEQISAKVTVQPAPAPSPEQAELAKLTAENQLTDQRLKKKLQQINAEKEELRAQYELELQKQKSKAAELEAELTRASAENKLAEEKNKKLMAELALRIAALKAENDLSAEQQRSGLLADSREKNAIDLELKRLDLEERKLKLEKMSLDARMSKLNSDLELRGRKAEWKKESNTDPIYLDQPFKAGKLTVSDRRIPLNGPIYDGVGDYVTERINYFNNISTQPIFIIIDYCPGGSTSEGYAILKAMESSRAPVYVAVKYMAASMAAVITTMAERSYAYPNATILHHQPWGAMIGNLTQQKERLDLVREWDRRLNAPVAKKMGLSMDEFHKKMYEKNSDGDWREFGDKAVEYKWVSGTVDKVEETGVLKNPDEKQNQKRSAGIAGLELIEKTDEKGETYVSLPRLKPFDFYFIHNPDNYYRY